MKYIKYIKKYFATKPPFFMFVGITRKKKIIGFIFFWWLIPLAWLLHFFRINLNYWIIHWTTYMVPYYFFSPRK